MFKNTGKKIFAVCLAFALCVPCFFASAQQPYYNVTWIYQEPRIEKAMREELKRVKDEYNMRYIIDDVYQMDNRKVVRLYNWLLKNGKVRPLWDLGLPYDETLISRNKEIRSAVYAELKLCEKNWGLRFLLNNKPVEVCKMSDETLMRFYNELVLAGLAIDVGTRMI